MKRFWLGAALAALSACGFYDVSGQGNPIITGVLDDHQALSAIIDAHRQQIDIMSLARGRVRHPLVLHLVLKNITIEQGNLARHTVMLATMNSGNAGPERTAAYDQIHDLHADVYRELRGLSGEDFDRAFLARTQSLYATIINFIDNRLKDDAQAWAWKQDLKESRNSYMARVSQIIDVRDQLGY